MYIHIYGISGRVLRNLAHVLALPTSIILQQSLAQDIFPSAWKEATVIPIHKEKAPETVHRRIGPLAFAQQ